VEAQVSASPTARSVGWRPLHPVTRAVLLVGSLLVFFAGVQLYALSTRTDDLFAWTIAVPLTAAVIGGFYWGSLPLAIGCGLQRVWVYARAGVLGITVFLWATLGATLLHLDKFHIHGEDWKAQSAGWLWIGIYVVVPVWMTIGVGLQFVMPGDDPQRAQPLPALYRAVAAVMGAGIVGIGVVLFTRPLQTDRWWPWPLTPLTARAFAAWVLGLGVVWLCVAYENDYARVRIALMAALWLGALELLALVRYADDLRNGTRAAYFAGAVVVTMLVAAAGLLSARSRARARRGP
jgi:hypothetical protein